MNPLTKHLPNFLTCMNILSGCIAIVFAFESYHYLHLASVMIMIGMIFDFLDGMTARLTKSYSPMGKELDSLADMVTFGLAPAVIVYQLLKPLILGASPVINFSALSFVQLIILFSPFLLAIFSGLRLAKFNIDPRQTESFIGLATPSNAFFIGSLPVVLHYNQTSVWINNLILTPFFLIPVAIVMSLLLVSEIPMFSFKFKSLRFADNKIRYIFLIVIVLLLVIFHTTGFIFIIPSYIILSLIENMFLKS